MSAIALPPPPQIPLPDYSGIGERLRLPKWAGRLPLELVHRSSVARLLGRTSGLDLDVRLHVGAVRKGFSLSGREYW